MKVFILFLIYTIVFFIFLLSDNLFDWISQEINSLLIYCFLFWYLLFWIFFYKTKFFKNNYKKLWIITVIFILFIWLYGINYVNFNQKLNTQVVGNEFQYWSQNYNKFLNSSANQIEKINWILPKSQRYIWYKYKVSESINNKIYNDLLSTYDNWKELSFPQEDIFFIEDKYIPQTHKNIINLSYVLISSEAKKWNTQTSTDILKTNIKIYNYLQQNGIFSGLKYEYFEEVLNENKQYFSELQIKQIEELLNQKWDNNIAMKLYILKLIEENKQYLDTQENIKTFFYNNHEFYIHNINYLKKYYTKNNFELLNKPNLLQYFLHRSAFYEEKIIWDINFWIKKIGQ